MRTKTLYKPEKFENAGSIFVFVSTENILKMKLSENDDITIVM